MLSEKSEASSVPVGMALLVRCEQMVCKDAPRLAMWPGKSRRRRGGRAKARFSSATIGARCVGAKRMTGQSLYYPSVKMRALAQVLTEEYSEHGLHVANVVIDGLIDSPGTWDC